VPVNSVYLNPPLPLLPLEILQLPKEISFDKDAPPALGTFDQLNPTPPDAIPLHLFDAFDNSIDLV
jgi:hypothetical protein